MNMFNNVAGHKAKQSLFDLSHERKTSHKLADLIPILHMPINPGDKVSLRSEIFMRWSPLVFPVLHRVNVSVHYFFVPNRLLWDEWEDFITGGRDGTKTPVVPTVRLDDPLKVWFKKGSLANHLGLPAIDQTVTVTQAVQLSALPFRAYQLIYNEYYQDQNLNEPIPFSRSGGSMSGSQPGYHHTLRKRCWEKDYFTSALPWSQRGPQVGVPVAGSFNPNYLSTSNVRSSTGTIPGDGNITNDGGITRIGAGNNVRIENLASPQALDSLDLTVEDLRRSVRLQEWLERQARAGSRYIETILSHFGVKSSDARLQRPEFLSGSTMPVTISEVLNTTGQINDSGNPQGTMAGHGITAGNHNGFKKYFEEHGQLLGIMSVLPRTAYQQGIDRHWLRNDKFDYPWPEFAEIGEQEIDQKEIYYDPANSQAGKVFGYQSRYAEEKYMTSKVAGDFTDNLDKWHMGRKFDSDPALNNSFVEARPSQRIFAVTDDNEDKLYTQVYHNMRAVRKLPYYGTPKL